MGPGLINVASDARLEHETDGLHHIHLVNHLHHPSEPSNVITTVARNANGRDYWNRHAKHYNRSMLTNAWDFCLRRRGDPPATGFSTRL